MASLTLTPTKTDLLWRQDGTIRVTASMSDPNGNQRASTQLIIDQTGAVFNGDGGPQVGTLTAAQLTALTNLGTKIDALISAADAAGKLVF